MKAAVVRGLIAHIERQVFLVLARTHFMKPELLEMHGALSELVVLGHALDQYVLGGSAGMVLVL